MSSALTVRLYDKIVHEVDIRAKKLRISRSEYIRKSIELMNKGMNQQEKKAKLIHASKKVRAESMVVNSEFAQIEHDPKI